MNRKKLLTLALITAGAFATATPLLAQPQSLIAAQATAAAVPDPARQVEELVRLFRNGDLAGLAEAAVPPAQWEEVRLAYDVQRLQQDEPEDRAEFEANLQRFTAPDAVDRLMAEIEPKLDEVRPQLPGFLLMGFGALQMAITSPDSELTEDQRESLQAAMPGLQAWANGTDFLNPDLMRHALTLVTDAARNAGLGDLDALELLPLEAVLDKAGAVFVAGKQAVRAYGIDLDAVADSLQVEVLEIDGETARIRTTVTLFQAPLATEHQLVLIDGRWYGKDTVAQIRHDEAALEG